MKKEDRPVCPHCEETLKKWEVPPFNFSDGLGWGTNFLYVCFNDECSFYVNGWKRMMDVYGQVASYRYMIIPDTGEEGAIPFMTPMAGKGNIIDEDYERELMEREALRQSLSKLYDLMRAQDEAGILDFLLDEDIVTDARSKAAEYIGEHMDIDVIEPIRNHLFVDEVVKEAANSAIEEIHRRHFTMECPYCAEIIKARAKICRFCKSELEEL
ncbi:MAG: zinc ribbon domain-containing protein [Nitrospirae bacterium]|nr:MAG: zinc ribbon domain-containing protein [Nitrospirota bacterium]